MQLLTTLLPLEKKQYGNELESEQMIETRFNIVHRDTYDAVKLLNSRLMALGQDACSSPHAQSLHVHRDDVLRDDTSKVDEQTAGAFIVIDDVPFIANPIKPATKPRDISQFDTQINNAGDDLSGYPFRTSKLFRHQLNKIGPPSVPSPSRVL